ncbi:MAG: deoxyribose-phosphate aldolase [Ruminiclostridium sp.]|nr:deoxyribose-phosphate aldolase [Ruminiclostridium sp.]
MTNEEIFRRIDHTLLSPTATLMQIRTLCIEALDYKTASVCIPPCYVKRVHDEFPTLNICTVIGFPLGYEVTEAKVLEASRAIADGANEIDMVVNITAIKNHDFDFVMEEIQEVKAACGSHILKVIAETCYLNEDEKIMLCHSVTTAGADFIKTSTGFGSAGATKEDIKLFDKNVGKNVKIKAAGGIKTREDMEEFIKLGCSRLGTSSGVKILTGKKKQAE